MQRYCGNSVDSAGTLSLAATVTVYLTGTVSLAQIYQDNLATPLANPFTSDPLTGFWLFYAVNGHYDVRFSGGFPTISPAYTIPDYLFDDPTGPTTLDSVISSSQNPANGTEFIRMAVTDIVGWRNNSNSSNLDLSINASDQLTFNGSVVAAPDNPKMVASVSLFNQTNVAVSATTFYAALAGLAGETQLYRLTFDMLVTAQGGGAVGFFTSYVQYTDETTFAGNIQLTPTPPLMPLVGVHMYNVVVFAALPGTSIQYIISTTGGSVGTPTYNYRLRLETLGPQP